MHAERDVLVTIVFPALRARLEALGLELFDVDLRWGVPETGVDGERANSWAYCRQWIDRVEPFFVCMLGQRYGWVPPQHEIVPGEDRLLYAEMSITEMEIRHAVLGRLQRRSFFYFRDAEVPPDAPAPIYREFVDGVDEARVAALKSAIRGTGRPVRLYEAAWTGTGFRGLDAFGEQVLADLWSGILRDDRFVSKDAWRGVLGRDPDSDPIYTDDSTPVPAEIADRIAREARPRPADPHDAETIAMRAFATTRRRWFTGRARQLQLLRAFVEDGTGERRLCVVRGAPGAGKSALLAMLAAELEAAGHAVVSHFVGATEQSADPGAMLGRLLHELTRLGATPPTAQEDHSYDALRRRLSSALEGHQGQRPVVLLIDAPNQLTGGHDLAWLPAKLGSGVRVVLSSPAVPLERSGRSDEWVAEALADRHPQPVWIDLPPLDGADVRQIVDAFLIEYCKQLDEPQKQILAAMDQARNPLYLLVFLHELRTLGGTDAHVEIRGIIEELADRYPDTAALFEWMLQRLEVFGAEAARLWWTFLSLGRAGMSGRELSELLGRALGDDGARAALRIERSVRRYLQRRGEQWDVFHGQLREAVVARYGPDDSRPFHRDLSQYFESRWAGRDRRALSELPHHFASAESWEQLERVLCDLDFIGAKCAAGLTPGLLSDYRQTLEALPEAGEEREREERLDAAIAEFAAGLTQHARQWTEARTRQSWTSNPGPVLQPPEAPLPNPPSSVPPKTAGPAVDDRSRFAVASRLERIRAFSRFVNVEHPFLARHALRPSFVLQHAYNWTKSGPVAETAASLLAADPVRSDFVLLRKREQRPSWDPHPPCVHTFRDEDWPSRVFVASADLRLLATPTSDAAIRVCDVKTRDERVLRAHDSRVSALAITPDGGRLFSGSAGELRLWDLSSAACLCRIHTEPPSDQLCLAMTADGRLGVSATGTTLSIWDLESGRLVRAQATVGERTWTLSMTHDGRRALTAHVQLEQNAVLQWWDLDSGECLSVWDAGMKWVTALALSCDGASALIAGSGGVTLRDLRAGTSRSPQWAPWINAASLTADGAYALLSAAPLLHVWDLEAGAIVKSLDIGRSTGAMSASADGRRSIVDHPLRLCDVENGSAVDPVQTSQLYSFFRHREAEAVAVTSAGRTVLCRTPDGSLGWWDAHSGAVREMIPGASLMPVQDAALSPDGKYVVVAVHDQSGVQISEGTSTFSVLALDSGRIVQQLERRPGRWPEYGSLELTPDCRLAVFVADERVRLWDLDDGSLSALPGVTSTRHAPLTPDASRIVVAAQMDLEIWDVSTRTRTLAWRAHEGTVREVRVTADGRAVSTDSRSIKVWNIETGACLTSIATENCVALAPMLDGIRLLSLHGDLLRLWDLDRRICLAAIDWRQELAGPVVHPSHTNVLFTSAQTPGILGVLEPNLPLLAAPPLVTPTRRWHFGAGSGAGRWADALTVVCAWCDHIFAVPQVRPRGLDFACPSHLCGRLLRATGLVCDRRGEYARGTPLE
jgi:WD40 repeat protein